MLALEYFKGYCREKSMVNPEEQVEKGRAGKVRSPATPSRSLGECVQDVDKIYRQYSHASFSKEEVASVLGMSASSGPFSGRIYTLREYGLLVEEREGYKVSQSFHTLNSSLRESADFKRAALSAIQRSAVFNEILEQFKSKLPTREAIAHRLETQRQFTTERAKQAAGVLEESMKFAGVLDSNNNILPIRDQGRQAEGDQDKNRIPEQKVQQDEVKSNQSPNMLKLDIALDGGRRITVYYPPDMTRAEADKTTRVLKAISGDE